MKLKNKNSGAFYFLLLFFFSACGGVGSQTGLLPAGGVTAPGGTLSAAQPLPAELPSPDADPTCHEPDRPCDTIFRFNEEERIVTAQGDGEWNIELKGHILHLAGDGPEPCCQDRFILVKDTENSLCNVSRIGEEGRIQIDIVTMGRPLPNLIFIISRRGQQSPEGLQVCEEVEDVFSDGEIPRIISHQIAWSKSKVEPYEQSKNLDLKPPY